MSDKSEAMTPTKDDLIEELRQCAGAVYLTCHEDVARDISSKLQRAANAIERLEAERKRAEPRPLREVRKEYAQWWLYLDDRWDICRAGGFSDHPVNDARPAIGIPAPQPPATEDR